MERERRSEESGGRRRRKKLDCPRLLCQATEVNAVEGQGHFRCLLLSLPAPLPLCPHHLNIPCTSASDSARFLFGTTHVTLHLTQQMVMSTRTRGLLKSTISHQRSQVESVPLCHEQEVPRLSNLLNACESSKPCLWRRQVGAHAMDPSHSGPVAFSSLAQLCWGGT